MPRGDKGAYTDKQKRKAEHIEEGYRERAALSKKEAEERAWRTVNKQDERRQEDGSGRARSRARPPRRAGKRAAATAG